MHSDLIRVVSSEIKILILCVGLVVSWSSLYLDIFREISRDQIETDVLSDLQTLLSHSYIILSLYSSPPPQLFHQEEKSKHKSRPNTPAGSLWVALHVWLEDYVCFALLKWNPQRGESFCCFRQWHHVSVGAACVCLYSTPHVEANSFSVISRF